MALIWMDGFDHYGTVVANIDPSYTRSACSLSNSAPRTGTTNLVVANSGTVRRNMAANATIIGAAVGFNISELGTDIGPLVFYDGATIQVGLYVNASGGITVYRTSTASVLGSSAPGLVSVGPWYHLEVRLVVDNAAGSVEVRLNGSTVVSLTGVDTQGTANAYVSGVGFATFGVATLNIDDFVLWDTTAGEITDFIGQARVGLVMPDGDTGTNTMVPSTGATSFGVIDEIPPNGDTDYLAAATSGLEANCTLTAPPVDVGDVLGVQAFAVVRKTDAGACSYAVGVNGALGAAVAVDTSYVIVNGVRELNPTGSVVWNAASIAAAVWYAQRTA